MKAKTNSSTAAKIDKNAGDFNIRVASVLYSPGVVMFILEGMAYIFVSINPMEAVSTRNS